MTAGKIGEKFRPVVSARSQVDMRLADNMTGLPVVQMMMSHRVVRVAGAWGGGTMPGMFGMGVTSTDFQQPASSRTPDPLLACSAKGSEGARLAVSVFMSSPSFQNYNWMSHGLLQFYMAAYMRANTGTGMGFDLGAVGQSHEGLAIDVSLVLDISSSDAYMVLTEYSNPTDDVCTSHSIGTILDSQHVQEVSYPRVQHRVTAPRNFEPLGLVKILSIVNNTVQNFKISSTEGLKMSDLAGRGFAVCGSISFNWDTTSVCDNPVYLCCGLTYSKDPAKFPS